VGVGKSYQIKINNKINLCGGGDETCCNRSLLGSFSNWCSAEKWGDKRGMGGVMSRDFIQRIKPNLVVYEEQELRTANAILSLFAVPRNLKAIFFVRA
jgi:hypothetical protein